MRHTTLMLCLRTVTLFDLTLTLACASMNLLCIYDIPTCHPFSSTLAECGLAAVARLVSAADKAKRVIFDLRRDIDQTFDF